MRETDVDGVLHVRYQPPDLHRPQPGWTSIRFGSNSRPSTVNMWPPLDSCWKLIVLVAVAADGDSVSKSVRRGGMLLSDLARRGDVELLHLLGLP